jgi:hypothetical protein
MRTSLIEIVEKLHDARMTGVMTVVRLDMLQELQFVQLVGGAGIG